MRRSFDCRICDDHCCYRKNAKEDHAVAMEVPLSQPMPPLYFVRVVSDRWLGSESLIPVFLSPTQKEGDKGKLKGKKRGRETTEEPMEE